MCVGFLFFFFKKKTAYEMRISDWSSDVCSSDLSYQPTAVEVSGYEAIFSDAKAEFRGRRHSFETHLEIAVSPEDDIELRRLHVSNQSRSPRTIEIGRESWRERGCQDV